MLEPLHAPRAAALLALLLVAACGEGSGGAADANTRPDAAFPCEREAEPGGTDFALELGVRTDDGGFAALADGDAMPIILGSQGLYMLTPEFRAELPITADAICFACVAEVSAAGSYGGLTQPGVVQFRAGADARFEAAPFLLLGGSEAGTSLDDQDVEVSMRCDGHGFSGAVQRSLHLYLE